MIIKKQTHGSDAAKLHAAFLYKKISPILVGFKYGGKFRRNVDLSKAIEEHALRTYSTQTIANYNRLFKKAKERGITVENIKEGTFKELKKWCIDNNINYGSAPKPDFFVALIYTLKKIDVEVYDKVKNEIEDYKKYHDFTEYVREADDLQFKEKSTAEKIKKGQELSAQLIDVIAAKQTKLEVTEADLKKAREKIEALEGKNNKLRKSIAILSQKFTKEELAQILKELD